MLILVLEHTLLVTDDGVEVLTARLADSPGGPYNSANYEDKKVDGVEGENGEVETVKE